MARLSEDVPELLADRYEQELCQLILDKLIDGRDKRTRSTILDQEVSDLGQTERAHFRLNRAQTAALLSLERLLLRRCSLLGLLLLLRSIGASFATALILGRSRRLSLFICLVLPVLLAHKFVGPHAGLDAPQGLLLRSLRETFQALVKEVDGADVAIVGEQPALHVQHGEELVSLFHFLEAVWQD